uniref:SANT domain-containing protein n=1 Tax=Leersia perrieri TaxID=77586 RepID=A0A0D9XRL5_9ORYZ
MDKPVDDDSAKNVSPDDEIREKGETEWTDDELHRFMKAMDNSNFDLKMISNYVGTRTICECKDLCHKYQRLFCSVMIHEANENIVVEEVSNSTPENGVTRLRSAISSKPCSMDNEQDQRPSIGDHGNEDAFIVSMSIAHDDQIKSPENNPQLCITTMDGKYSALYDLDIVRSPVQSEKMELNPVGIDNKVITQKENPQISHENSEPVIHSKGSSCVKLNGIELSSSDNANIDFNRNLSKTASGVNSPRVAVSFDLSSSPVVDLMESETSHTETLTGSSSPTLPATNVLVSENGKRGSIRSELPDNCLKSSKFHQEGQSFPTMQIGTTIESSFSQADDILSAQKIQHPKTTILETTKDPAKKTSFVRIFGKIFNEDSCMEVNSNSDKYSNIDDGLTFNVTTSMVLPNTMCGDLACPSRLRSSDLFKMGQNNLSNVRTGSTDLVNNQQAADSNVISFGKTRDDVASHLWTVPSGIVNLGEQPVKNSTLEGRRMFNGYPCLSDLTHMIANFQALGSGGQSTKTDGGSTRNTKAMESKQQCKEISPQIS